VLSDYNPVLAAAGARAAFQTVRGGRTAIVVRELASDRDRVVARGARFGGARFADVYDPGLSADGAKLVYTFASGRVKGATTSDVRVVDLRTGRTTVIAAPRGGFATGGALSPDGRWVAYTTGRTGLWLRDLASGRTVAVPTGGAHVLDAVVARGARVVAFTSVRGGRSAVQAWTRGSAATTLVSRASGAEGAAADRDAGDPSISDDGQRVAFASAATNLVAGKADGKRAVFVRDVPQARTQLVSNPAAAYPAAALARFVAAAKAAGPRAPARARRIPRPRLRTDEVAITDNTFFAGADRPTLRIRTGQTVTWRWAARESHGLAVQSGPEHFATAARTGARFSHRFEQTGTYQLVCPLHAPGMRMTVVVQ
jgi:plastocyanin